jgi:hypothetical protein
MKDFLLNKLNDWIVELNDGSNQEKEKAKLLTELKSELQLETEALDRLSRQVTSMEEELIKRLHFKVGDYAVATIDEEDRIGQISEIHTISLSPSIVIIGLSPHFYPEYLMDIDKLRKPSPDEITDFETNRINIEEDIKRQERVDKA